MGFAPGGTAPGIGVDPGGVAPCPAAAKLAMGFVPAPGGTAPCPAMGLTDAVAVAGADAPWPVLPMGLIPGGIMPGIGDVPVGVAP